MTLHTLSTAVWLTFLVLPLFILRSYSINVHVSQAQAPKSDHDLVEFHLNPEYLVAEFFLYGATGRGLNVVAPELTQGGPPPVGGELANLDPFAKDLILQFALQKVGHLRAINRVVKGFPEPLINISKELFAEFVDEAFGQRLNPPFNPYANTLNFLLLSYGVSDFAPPGYVGISPKLQNPTFKRLVARLAGVGFGQCSVIRAYLYERRNLRVAPYAVTVAEFLNRLTELGNRLGNQGTINEGIVVPPSEGAEGKVSGNLIAADKDSLSYAKEPETILRILYGGGNERVPGGFFPRGANGRVARSYLSGAP